MDCVIIRVMDLPGGIRGATVKDAEGDYNVYINAKLSEEERVKAYWHEVEHIRRGHFYDERPVSVKEDEVHYGKTDKTKRPVDGPGVRL